MRPVFNNISSDASILKKPLTKFTSSIRFSDLKLRLVKYPS